MNPRERLLTGLIAVVGLAYAGNWAYRTKIAEPRQAKDQRRENLAKQLDDLELLQLRHDKGEAEMRAWRLAALSVKPGAEAQTAYNNYIKKRLVDAGIANPTVNSRAPSAQGENYATLPIDVNASCRLPQLAAFLDALQRGTVLQRVAKLTVDPNVKDDKLVDFKVALTVEALAFKDLGKEEQDKLRDRPRPDGKKLADFAWFADKNIFQPTRVEAIPKADAAVAVAPPPPRDDRAKVKPVGRISEAGGEVIWFRNEAAARDADKLLRIALGGELKVPGMTATLSGFDPAGNQVLLLVGGKLGAVRMGQPLSTWKELPSAVAAAGS